MANGTQAGLYTSSSIINGQLVPQTRTGLYAPYAVGPVVQGVPASPPQSPPGYSGGSDAGRNVSAMANNPWSPTQSPVPWLIGMFLVGFILMRYVHWGYK